MLRRKRETSPEEPGEAPFPPARPAFAAFFPVERQRDGHLRQVPDVQRVLLSQRRRLLLRLDVEVLVRAIDPSGSCADAMALRCVIRRC